jgi:hypothetical protein
LALADDQPPLFDHAPPAEFTRGQPLTIRATITSPAGRKIFEPKLYVRNPGTEYVGVKMVETRQKNVFEAAVVPGLLFERLEYYLEAFDVEGNGPSRVASAKTPLSIRMVVPPEPVAPPAVAKAAPGDAVAKPVVVKKPFHWSTAGMWVGGILLVGGVGVDVASALIIGLPAWRDGDTARARELDFNYLLPASIVAGVGLTTMLVSYAASPDPVVVGLMPTSGGGTLVVSGRF